MHKKGKDKMTKRNRCAETNRKLSQNEFISNNITMKGGTFRLVKIIIKNQAFAVLIDSGASHSCLNLKMVKALNLRYTKCTVFMSTANGDSESNVIGQLLTDFYMFDIHNKPHLFDTNFLVLQNSNKFAGIIGVDILYNLVDSILSKDKWVIKTKRMQIVIPLKHATVGETDNLPENNETIITNIKCCITSLNSLQYEKPNDDKIQANDDNNATPRPSDLMIEQEFNSFLNCRPLPNNIEYTNQTKFADNVQQIQDENKNLVLQHDFVEKHAQHTVLTDGDKYIKQVFSIKTIPVQHIPEPYRTQFIKLCYKYSDVFAKHNFDVSKNPKYQHKIQVHKAPPSQNQRFLPQAKLQFAEEACKKLLDNDIIEISKQPLTISNLVLVPKVKTAEPNDKKAFRLTVDLRLLNQATLNVLCTPCINITEFISKIKGKILSNIDLTQSYFNIFLHEDSRPLTAFYLGNKIMQWKRLSQGLLSSGQAFNLALDDIFSDENFEKYIKQVQQGVLTATSFMDILQKYIDDLFLHTQTYEQHLIAVELLFLALRDCGFKINPSKSRFLATEITVLGHKLSSENTQLFLDELKLQGLISLPRPTSLHDLQSKLCMIAYYQNHLPKLKEIAFPLFNALRTRTFIWDEIMEFAWQGVITIMKCDVRLVMPQAHEVLYVFCDASLISCSQILMVEREGKLHLAACASKLFSVIDCRKSSYIREAISLMQCFIKFKPFLYATHKEIQIFTDCRSLLFAGRQKEHSISASSISSYLARMSLELNFKVYHLNTKLNFLADLLSRAYTKSRFIGKPSLTREQAKFMPNIDSGFCVKSADLYDFLT